MKLSKVRNGSVIRDHIRFCQVLHTRVKRVEQAEDLMLSFMARIAEPKEPIRLGK